MGQQLRTRVKRKRRRDYLKRARENARTRKVTKGVAKTVEPEVPKKAAKKIAARKAAPRKRAAKVAASKPEVQVPARESASLESAAPAETGAVEPGPPPGSRPEFARLEGEAVEPAREAAPPAGE
ncbi:MAG: hypothetical protein ACR2OZ_07520 [Verrucomicrobiales bacterium]